MNKISQKTNNSSKSGHQSIKALCNQSPFLIINTPCGVARYKFNKIGYQDNTLVIECKLLMDSRNNDIANILYTIGNKCYLTIDQFLYALKFYASA